MLWYIFDKFLDGANSVATNACLSGFPNQALRFGGSWSVSSFDLRILFRATIGAGAVQTSKRVYKVVIGL